MLMIGRQNAQSADRKIFSGADYQRHRLNFKYFFLCAEWMLNILRGECKKFSAQRCLRCCLKEAVERVIFVNFNRLWACSNVFVERGIILLNQKLKNPAIALSLMWPHFSLTSSGFGFRSFFPFLHYFAALFVSRFRKISITALANSGRKKNAN